MAFFNERPGDPSPFFLTCRWVLAINVKWINFSTQRWQLEKMILKINRIATHIPHTTHSSLLSCLFQLFIVHAARIPTKKFTQYTYAPRLLNMHIYAALGRIKEARCMYCTAAHQRSSPPTAHLFRAAAARSRHVP